MRRRLATPIACLAILLLAGCGSSSKSGATTTAGAATATTTTSPSTTTPTGNGGGLRPYTKPKFAAPEASAPVQSGVVQIAYRNFTINPDTLRVKLGSTIKWTNYDEVPHNVTSEGGAGGTYKFASKNFGEGGTFEIKAVKPGVIHYESTTQPATMNGSIEVVR